LTILEAPAWEAIKSVAVPLVYAGVMSCGVAYTLQILGQKYVEPAKAVLPLLPGIGVLRVIRVFDPQTETYPCGTCRMRRGVRRRAAQPERNPATQRTT
jgi:hypothetical protein